MRLAPAAFLGIVLLPVLVSAQSSTSTSASRGIEVRFTPAQRAQIALWLEKPDGTFVKTLYLTSAVGYRGIGNRPGAAVMNSGFHWPYGRREGVLPIWAHRRASAPGAKQWNRVIFQKRTTEGDASQTSADQSKDDYFCLSFNNSTTKKEALDAVTCASMFSSDKGRYITSDDTNEDKSDGYYEPLDDGLRKLDLVSLYPPRRDITRCADGSTSCFDHADVAKYVDDARTVMPDIDSVTMATPPGGEVEQSFLFPVSDDIANGDYVLWAEVNTEGDSNDRYTFTTPMGGDWDIWAEGYGYSYRGQPSVAFTVPIKLGATGTFTAAQPTGYGDVEGFGDGGGTMHPMDATITNDPSGSPGSGADRFRMMNGNDYRLKIAIRGGTGMGGSSGDPCMTASTPPAAPQAFVVSPVNDVKHSHEWGHMHFAVPDSAIAIHDYDVRVSESPITTSDPTSFDRAPRANVASLEDEMLIIPTSGAAGSSVDVDFGHLKPSTSYFVAIRATNLCTASGPFVVSSFSTTKINFTKLSGCFIATAAYGSAMEPSVQAMRVVRDSARAHSPLFATFAELYARSAPPAAALIGRSDGARAVVRGLLGPVANLAGALAPQLPSEPR